MTGHQTDDDELEFYDLSLSLLPLILAFSLSLGAAQGDLGQGNAKEIGTERRAAADTVLGAEIESTGNVAVIVIDIMKNVTGTEIGNGIEKGKESTDVTDERERE